MSEQLELPEPIPLGLCGCGCGQATNIAPQSNKKMGYVRGQPYRFCLGHRIQSGYVRRSHFPMEARSGLCECGCGEQTPIARKSSARLRTVAGQPYRFVRGHENRVAKAERNNNWRGGRTVTNGYISVRTPGHHRADDRGYVSEHVLVVERAMGKPLRKTADIHHVDGNRKNNVATNLVVCQDHAYHMLLHRRQKALAACGDPNAHRCKMCGRYDNQDDIRTCVSKGHFNAWHHKCDVFFEGM